MSEIVQAEQVRTITVERTPEVIAAEIRYIDSQTRKFALQAFIEIGKRLTEVKEMVPHGEWGKWLENNVNYSQSTANNFMRIASEYGNSESPAFAELSYTQAVALLSLPEGEREKFVEENDVSKMSSRKLQEAIKKQKELQKELEEKEARLKAEQEARAEEERKREALWEQYQKELELRKTQEQQLYDLQAELEKAKKAGADDKALAKLKAEFRKLEREKQEQEGKLSELQQKIEEEKKAEEQRIAERLKQREQELMEQAKAREDEQTKQLEELKKQLARANNEHFLRAKIALDQLIKDGEALIKAIAAVSDPEQEKLKSAAGKIVEKIRSML